MEENAMIFIGIKKRDDEFEKKFRIILDIL